MKYSNHYKYLEANLPKLFKSLGLDYPTGIIVAHGDKCYSYKDIWENAGIPFYHGVAIYLLSYVRPYSHEVRETRDKWVEPYQWVIDNYPAFKPFLV